MVFCDRLSEGFCRFGVIFLIDVFGAFDIVAVGCGPVEVGGGVNGAGQTIGIINDSNVDLDVVAAYRKLFKLDATLGAAT